MSISLPSVQIDVLKVPIRNAPIAMLTAPTVPPRSLLAQLNWATDYGAGSAKPNVNVLVSVAAGGAQPPIDCIRSVKIDNLGNPFPVYVFFLDSTDTIVAPPNTEVWEPVVTNAKIANVILMGATDNTVGKTNVYFCNVIVPPYVNAEISQAVSLWKASPSIARSNAFQPNYGPPALGDQFGTATCDAAVANSTSGLFGSPLANGFFYLTSFTAYYFDFVTSAFGSTTVNLVSTAGDTLIRFPFISNAGTGQREQTVYPPVAMSGMNVKLDATKTWQIKTIGASGFASLQFVMNYAFTYNPS